MSIRIALHAFLLLLLSVTLPAAARSLHGSVSHVTDGDTIWVRPTGAVEAEQIRLQGIDAPEICQPFGAQSRDALAARVLHRQVQVAIRARDVYQRGIGRVTMQGDDVAAWLVERGYAWAARFHGRAGPYAKLEARARAERRGLWASAAQEPRNFRKTHGSCH
jgi:endonuclease YncB( thermonuclease family)